MVLLDEYSRDRQQPPAVVREAQIHGALDVDVADASSLLGQPDAAPGKHFADDVGHVLPVLVVLVLVLHRGVGLATDVVHGLHVRDEPGVVEHVRGGCVGQFGVGRLEPRDELELGRSFIRVAHGRPSLSKVLTTPGVVRLDDVTARLHGLPTGRRLASVLFAGNDFGEILILDAGLSAVCGNAGLHISTSPAVHLVEPLSGSWPRLRERRGDPARVRSGASGPTRPSAGAPVEPLKSILGKLADIAGPSGRTGTRQHGAMTITFITGANKGLGYETARRLVEQGHIVLLGARDPELGRAAADALGARFVQVDVTDDASVAAAVKDVEEHEGSVDVLINNAGVAGPYADAADLTAEDFHAVFDVNVLGVVRTTTAFLPVAATLVGPGDRQRRQRNGITRAHP